MTGDARETLRRLAHDHLAVMAPTSMGSLAPRLDAVERGLADVYRRLGDARYAPGERPGAVEWLLDNGYVIQNAAEQVRQNVPRGFYRKLPSLREGPGAGLTRVEHVVEQLLHESVGPIDLGAAAGLLDAYQDVAPLAVGELWALPAMMRLLVLESLLPAAVAAVGFGPERRAAPPPADQRASGDETVAQAVRSLRVLAGHDWKDFVEAASHLDRMLRHDPSGDYPRMDFASRDRYRREVERLTRGSRGHDELDVAAAALELADAAPAGTRAHHVGAYLIAEERARLEEAIGFTPPPSLRVGRALEPHAAAIYLTTTAVTAVVTLALPLLWLASIRTPGWAIAGAALFALVPAWSLAAAIVDWLVTLVVPARRLPRMDAEESVPDDARTVVVTPVILGSVAEVEPLLAMLEINYLGNRDDNLGFALLTDLSDARRRSIAPRTTRSSRPCRTASAASTGATSRGTRARGSTSCTGSAAGTRWSGCGWAGSGSAASSRSSTPSSPGAAPPPSAPSSTCPTTSRACATSSRSTPTRGCRPAAPASWWPPSATRSSARSSTRRATSCSPASPSCSPASRPTPRRRSRRASPER
jgi:cyclic beta-1,2-glucan synthetase